jgi:aspartate/tyrosine/aromatic aminotransferase
MFDAVALAPPDPILGLTEAFNQDSRPNKINLGVGVFKDAAGKTPVLASVKQAERRLLDTESSKNYLPIDGSPQYAALVQELLLGKSSTMLAGGRCVTADTPGGTGALRVAADYLARNHKSTSVWMSEPTWPNHPQIFAAAGLPVKTYPYFDAADNALAFDAMLDALRKIPGGDVVLLHACCHNPTGVDPNAEQWKEISRVLAERGVLPLLDFAYQGFGDGLAEDAAALHILTERCPQVLVASSFSKNFGLYNERVGALTAIAANADHAAAVLSQIKSAIRANYSNPPAHGGLIVTTILADGELRQLWLDELTQMRERIHSMRRLFTDTLKAKGVNRDFSFIARQKGMFSFSGLNKAQVEALKTQHAIYIVGSGRINVAGMTPTNMDRLCEAIIAVL